MAETVTVDLSKVFGFGKQFFDELTEDEQWAFMEIMTPIFYPEEEEVVEEDPTLVEDDDLLEEDPPPVLRDPVVEDEFADEEEEDAGGSVPAGRIQGVKRPKRPPREPLPKGERPAKWPKDAPEIRRRLLELFRSGAHLSPKQAIVEIGRSAWAVRMVLWKMHEDGEVSREGMTNATKYKLAEGFSATS